MKNYLLFSLILAGTVFLSPAMTQQTSDGRQFIGYFEGRTPCQELAQQLQVEKGPQCIKIKWRLALYADGTAAGNSGTYELMGLVYPKENPRTGKWSVMSGTPANPRAVVYKLEQEKGEPIFLQKMDDNVFMFLDPDLKLMAGNRDFSYALNRARRP